MNIDRNKIIQILKDRNLSITENRIRIIKCLNDENDHFHAIRDISNHTNLNTKSIYNNIKIMISKGLINSVSTGGVVQYAFNENIINEIPEIHITDGKGNISHLEVPKKIFENIEKKVMENGKKVVAITINVNVK